VLPPGNRTKPCKFLYVKPLGNYGRYSDRRRKLTFLTTVLSFDTTSPANPDEYRHKPYNARNHRPWATFLPLTVYVNLCLKQSCLKTRADTLKIRLQKQYLVQMVLEGHLVICFDVDEKPFGDCTY